MNVRRTLQAQTSNQFLITTGPSEDAAIFDLDPHVDSRAREDDNAIRSCDVQSPDPSEPALQASTKPEGAVKAPFASTQSPVSHVFVKAGLADRPPVRRGGCQTDDTEKSVSDFPEGDGSTDTIAKVNDRLASDLSDSLLVQKSTSTDDDPASSPLRDGPIRVCIVEDHPAICEAVRELLGGTVDLNMHGEAATFDDGFRLIETLQPDVAIIDIALSDGHGLDLIRNLEAQFPSVKTVVFSMFEEKVHAERALRAGASGYVMKTEPTERLIASIRRVYRGKVDLSQEVTTRIVRKFSGENGHDSETDLDALTDRELEVFQMIGQGRSLEEIRKLLNLSRKAVETHRRHVKRKLGFESFVDLIQYAVRWSHGRGLGGAASL